jgi:hypothetical protein
MAQIALELMNPILTAEARAGQLLGDRVEIGNHVLLNPVDDRFLGLESEVEVLAPIGDESEAEKGAANAVIFSVEEVSQRCTGGT